MAHFWWQVDCACFCSWFVSNSGQPPSVRHGVPGVEPQQAAHTPASVLSGGWTLVLCFPIAMSTLGCACDSSTGTVLPSAQDTFRAVVVVENRFGITTGLTAGGDSVMAARPSVASVGISASAAGALVCERCGEAGTVRCSRCKTARYCSASCQQAHWKVHKPSCSPATATKL